MAKILILGAGVMGTAITIPLFDNQHEIRLVGTHLDAEIINELQQSHIHPRLKIAIPEAIEPYTIQQLEQAAGGIDLIILGVNSLGVKWAAKALSDIVNPSIPILILTKGLEGSNRKLQILPEAFRAMLPKTSRDAVPIMAIGGPSIAGELAARRQTFAVITGQDPALLDSCVKLMRTSYYHPRINTDHIGVEISVGLKNLYALGVGIVQGLVERDGVDNLGPMHNLSAALFTQSLLETAYIGEKLGGQRETVFSLAGVGDLYVTCQNGRNFRMGHFIGLGMTYEQARSKYMPNDTIEGAELAFAIEHTVHDLVSDGFFSEGRIPLLLMLLGVICRNEPFNPQLDEFIA